MYSNKSSECAATLQRETLWFVLKLLLTIIMIKFVLNDCGHGHKINAVGRKEGTISRFLSYRQLFFETSNHQNFVAM